MCHLYFVCLRFTLVPFLASRCANKFCMVVSILKLWVFKFLSIYTPLRGSTQKLLVRTPSKWCVLNYTHFRQCNFAPTVIYTICLCVNFFWPHLTHQNFVDAIIPHWLLRFEVASLLSPLIRPSSSLLSLSSLFTLGEAEGEALFILPYSFQILPKILPISWDFCRTLNP